MFDATGYPDFGPRGNGRNSPRAGDSGSPERINDLSKFKVFARASLRHINARDRIISKFTPR